MKYMTMFCLIGLSGCASLHSKVFNNIHEGDSISHVREVLGEPDQFGESKRMPGANAWYYTKKADTCGLTIFDEKVAYVACQTDGNYKNAVSKSLEAFSQGLNQANANQLHCTSYNNGGIISTNCH